MDSANWIHVLHVTGSASMTSNADGKRWFTAATVAITVAHMARERDLVVIDDDGSFLVPRGTPWQEALPLG